MKRARSHQKGYVFRKGNAWYLRYREHQVQADGTLKLVQKCRKLADFGGLYRSLKAVQGLADEFLAPLKDGTMAPESTMTLTRFIEERYLPYVKDHLKPSTYAGYRNLFQLHLRQRGDIALRDVHTVEAEEMLNDIARKSDPARETIKRIKTFLSGAFRYAKRMGILNGENPMRDTVLPRCRRGGETYAYPLEQFLEMLRILPEPAVTIVALAGFAGLREGELKGARWENYREGEIFVSQSVWRGHLDEPKTPQSMAPVPVVAQLAQRLDAFRTLCGSPEKGWMFPNSVGKPRCTAKLVRDVIRPRLNEAGIEWHGWHAFRRGLATNLYRLGVADKVIQVILRHSNVSVTQRCYIKTADPDAVSAMRKLECATSVQLESRSRPQAAPPRAM